MTVVLALTDPAVTTIRIVSDVLHTRADEEITVRQAALLRYAFRHLDKTVDATKVQAADAHDRSYRAYQYAEASRRGRRSLGRAIAKDSEERRLQAVRLARHVRTLFSEYQRQKRHYLI